MSIALQGAQEPFYRAPRATGTSSSSEPSQCVFFVIASTAASNKPDDQRHAEPLFLEKCVAFVMGFIDTSSRKDRVGQLRWS